MLKKVVFFFCVMASSTVVFSCSVAAPMDSAAFCASFESVARCHCTASGVPQSLCSNMKLLFQRLVASLGSLQKACEWQHDTTTQNCIDSWRCYLYGGVNSQQQLCNGTGAACPH